MVLLFRNTEQITAHLARDASRRHARGSFMLISRAVLITLTLALGLPTAALLASASVR